MRRFVTFCLTLVAAALLVLPAAATAATNKTPAPQITRVQPMRVSVGSTLTITGNRFKSTRRKNTVIFRASNGRTAFVKPRRATTRKLVLTVTSSVARLLRVSNNRQQPTRLQLRVLAGQFSKFTPRRLSPVVTALGDGDGRPAPDGPGPGSPGPGGPSVQVCETGADHDGDLLANSFEISTTHTDPCLKDTDGDGVEDGFEYQSAVDLNDDEYQEPNDSLPYPGKKPYPNPLDPTDAKTDYDRDVLTLGEEHKLWHFAISQGSTAHSFPLYYSDGLQASFSARGGDGRRIPTVDRASYDKHQNFVSWTLTSGYRTVQLSDGAPWWDHANTRNTYGLFDFDRDGDEQDARQPGQRTSELYYFDHDNDGFVSDDERDEDADGLDNYEETHGRLSGSGYWEGCYSQEAGFPVKYSGTDVTDQDTDNDGVRDGADDQDHDDIPNLLEVSRIQASGLDDRLGNTDCKPATGLPAPPATWHPNAYGRVNPFNPCLPATWSRTCDLHPGLEDATAPFDGSPDWYSLN
jgi:IPT/TIG domain